MAVDAREEPDAAGFNDDYDRAECTEVHRMHDILKIYSTYEGRCDEFSNYISVEDYPIVFQNLCKNLKM